MVKLTSTYLQNEGEIAVESRFLSREKYIWLNCAKTSRDQKFICQACPECIDRTFTRFVTSRGRMHAGVGNMPPLPSSFPDFSAPPHLQRGLNVNTIEATCNKPEIPGKRKRTMPNQAHIKAAEHHENAAKSHRSAAEHHGKNDHMKGNEHSTEAQKHSKVAGEHSEQAHAKSTSKK
jgi:hypothetical protein